MSGLSKRGTLLLVVLLVFAVALPGAATAQEDAAVENGEERMGTNNTDNPEQAPAGSLAGTYSQLAGKAEREGTVRVIVGLRTDYIPEGRLSTAQRANQRNEIESAQSTFRTVLDRTGYQTLRQYDTVPAIALEVSPRTLEAIRRSPLVTGIAEDLPIPATQAESTGMNLAESTAIVQAPEMWNDGFTGNGQVIAVLDSGVDLSHEFLSGKVVEEACFTSGSEKGPTKPGNCPNDKRTQYGEGSAVPCSFDPNECDHGTHVAGIAAGQGSTRSGVAKGAKILPVQIFSNCADAGEGPCSVTYASDQMAALEHVYNLRYIHDFASINLSFGSVSSPSRCDDAIPRYKLLIDNLKDAGIATVIASGNDGFKDRISFPACISSAVSVGSTTESDDLSPFSNSASFLSLLAPGSGIGSSVPGGGFAAKSGTSMAAPHVAGAWALLKQKDPGASVDSIRQSLQGSGTLVMDTRKSLKYPTGTGITKPRINIADAATTLNPIEMTNTNDSGGGSLRQAIIEANENARTDTVKITATGTVELKSALPDLATDMHIVGPGADQFTVKRSEALGTPDFRIFTVGEEAMVTISGLTITNGVAAACEESTASTCGGGIENLGALTIESSAITGNTAESGGGVSNANGDLTIESSAITRNIAEAVGRGGGGGISNYRPEGTATVTGSTISENFAENSGGGISNTDGTLTVERSTISDNSAGDNAGGIENVFGTLTVEDSTISYNKTAGRDGGGIHSYYAGDLSKDKATVTNTTISGNSSGRQGGGVYNLGSRMVIEYSTIKNNTAPEGHGGGVYSNGNPDDTTTEVFSSIIAGNRSTDVDFVRGSTNSFTSKGYNLIGDGNATRAFDATGDRVGVTNPGRVTTGTRGVDTLIGTSGSDIIYGFGGDDTIGGGGGDDIVRGGPGDDLLRVRDGRPRDLANGDSGKDRCAADRGDRRVGCER